MKKGIKRYLSVSLLAFCLVACSNQPDCEMDMDNNCFVRDPMESVLAQQKLNSFPILSPKPIYWQGDKTHRYPENIDLPYIYIKKSDGVWLRYRNFPEMDFFINSTIPDGYLYQEVSEPITTPENIRKYTQVITLSDTKTTQTLYQQAIYNIRIENWNDWKSRYENHRYPRNIEKIMEQITSLQVALTNFPQEKLDIKHSAKDSDQKNLLLTGNIMYSPTNNHEFTWRFDKNLQQKIYLENQENNKLWAVGGKEYNLIINELPQITHPMCTSRSFAQLNFQLIKNEPFGTFEDFNINESYELKEGYSLENIASYAIKNRRFVSTSDNKIKEMDKYEVTLFDSNNHVISQECQGNEYIHKSPGYYK